MTLVELFELLRKHLGVLFSLPIAFALIAGIWSLTRPNQYTTATTMYVLSKQQTEESISQSDLNASQMLTNDVATILRSNRVKRDVAQRVGLDSLKDYSTSITNSTTTRVITLSVTGSDPEMCARVANAHVEAASSVAQEVMDISSVNSIDEAQVPNFPSGPKRLLYTAVGAAAGLFASVALIILSDVLNMRIRSSSDVEELLDIAVVGHFPKLERSA